jgi:hypothetical protein
MFTRPVAKIVKAMNALRAEAEDSVLNEAEEDKAAIVAAKLDGELAKLANSSAFKKRPETKRFLAVLSGAMRKYYEGLPAPVLDPEDRMEEEFSEKKRATPDASSVVDVASDAKAEEAKAKEEEKAEKRGKETDNENEDPLNPGSSPKKLKRSKKSKVKETEEQAE